MSIDFNQEWRFIITETHREKSNKINLVKREILFGLQILLGKMENKNYLTLKKIYCAEKSK